jgi:hypothetical protein
MLKKFQTNIAILDKSSFIGLALGAQKCKFLNKTQETDSDLMHLITMSTLLFLLQISHLKKVQFPGYKYEVEVIELLIHIC